MARLVHARVREGFAPLLQAWSNRDPDEMRRHVSNAYLEQTRGTLEALDRDFRVNRLEGCDLHDAAVRRPTGSTRDESVPAYIAFVARDWVEDLRTGKVVGGERDVARAFTQCWTCVFEPSRGWVVDRIERLGTGEADAVAAMFVRDLPAGWYSAAENAANWSQWDGSAWVTRHGRGSQARRA
jgi:hypothetical protein